jgi:hypothetical protein
MNEDNLNFFNEYYVSVNNFEENVSHNDLVPKNRNFFSFSQEWQNNNYFSFDYTDQHNQLHDPSFKGFY